MKMMEGLVCQYGSNLKGKGNMERNISKEYAIELLLKMKVIVLSFY